MGTFLVRMKDGSEQILTAGRASRTERGDVAFESIDAGGDWYRVCTVPGHDVESAYSRRARGDGSGEWVRQPSEGRWWAH